MKNRLLYTLISLMVVSLIGIIAIQSIWISGAIKNREDDFSTHVNDAMNKVNDDIGKDEASFFIKRQFGDVDSLLNEFVFISDSEDTEDRTIVIENKRDHALRIDLENYHGEDGYHHGDTIRHNITRDVEYSHENGRWQERIEVKMERLDSTMEATLEMKELGDAHAQHVKSMIRHHTIERLLNGKLKDRITYKELQKKLAKALKKEGIKGPFEFAVYNKHTKKYEEGYISKGFDKEAEDQEFKKILFPSDRRKVSVYELIVQSDNKSGYVWKGVQQMALLSGIFTILILLSFGYALYFIFKQKKISKVKNDFINNMTHELKTPLASISLASSSINHPEVIGKPEEIKKFTAVIESEKHRINSHIERVLDIATLDKGDLKLDLAETDLISIIQSGLKNVDLSLSEIGGKSSFKTDLDAAHLRGDEFHLTNVLTNILDNSIKYRKDALTVDITLTKNADNYMVTVKDNGIGMTSKEQSLAFDKFYRAETGNIHNVKGFGLGLSYVKGIVEQHQGSVSISSQKNAGTTVTIILPMNNE